MKSANGHPDATLRFKEHCGGAREEDKVNRTYVIGHYSFTFRVQN